MPIKKPELLESMKEAAKRGKHVIYQKWEDGTFDIVGEADAHDYKEKIVRDCNNCPFGFSSRAGKAFCAYHQDNAQSVEKERKANKLPPIWCPLTGEGTLVKLVTPKDNVRKLLQR